MKNTFLLFTFCLFLAACTPQNKQEVADSLDENNPSVKASRQENILESLYLELKEQRPELDALDKQIQEVDDLKNKALENYKAYNGKNEQYYSTAGQYLSNIQDSLLRNSIELLLHKSQYAYDQDNAAMALAAAQLESRSTSLHDHQQALKIILTMDLIQKYQKKQLPNTSEYKKIIDRYNESIRTADSLLQTK